MKFVTIHAPAKINLNLKIGDLQENGYHYIESLMHTIDLVDEILIRTMPITTGLQKIRIIIDGPQKSGVPANAANLAHKAAKFYFEKSGIRQSIEIKIIKNIPNKAGLGGASSNAASVIKALEAIFDYKLEINQEIATDLGSDVVFFLRGAPCARVFGIGECWQKLPARDFHYIIVMLPRIQIATKWAYERYDQGLFSDNLKTDINDQLFNDFEKVIFKYFPDLRDFKNSLLKYGANYAGLCGSGSALFGIFDNYNIYESTLNQLSNQEIIIASGKSCVEDFNANC